MTKRNAKIKQNVDLTILDRKKTYQPVLTSQSFCYKRNMSRSGSKKEKVKKILVGPEVVAEHLSVSRNTILNWARDGKIPCVRVGKIYRFSMKLVSESINYPLDAA